MFAVLFHRSFRLSSGRLRAVVRVATSRTDDLGIVLCHLSEESREYLAASLANDVDGFVAHGSY